MPREASWQRRSRHGCEPKFQPLDVFMPSATSMTVARGQASLVTAKHCVEVGNAYIGVLSGAGVSRRIALCFGVALWCGSWSINVVMQLELEFEGSAPAADLHAQVRLRECVLLSVP
mmetsp:Transcript_127665/g.408639  ORF Transcript_127665/g.408639 Transcript_127665/m.408639 type:complete len:117 (-) Transcript_127665:203-553(-)